MTAPVVTREHVERFVAAVERIADALAAKAAPKPAPAPRTPKPTDSELPEGFPDALRPFVEPVGRILHAVAQGNGAQGAIVPTRRALGLALMDNPDKDFVPAAQEYRAWQLGGKVRNPHRDVVSGYRNQLKRSPAVTSPTPPPSATGPVTREDRDEAQRRRLEEAMA